MQERTRREIKKLLVYTNENAITLTHGRHTHSLMNIEEEETSNEAYFEYKIICF